MKRFTKALMTTTMVIAAGALVATSAMATDGMFGNGTGARNKALAGAGVADQNDATAMSINPAGLSHSPNQLAVSASLFSPLREFDGDAGGPGPAVESNSNYFVIPNIAYSHRVDGSTVFGLSMYGNGGMNTDYPDFTNPACAGPGGPGGGSGLACRGEAGIDLQQIFLSAGLAKQYGNISVGVAPILAIQLFEATGLATPGGLVSNDLDVAVGIGARGGVEVALSDNFRVAVAGATPIYMQTFGDYKDLFAAGERPGELRLPATIQAGVAFDVMPSLTVMADYKHIFYSGVGAIGTSNLANPGGFSWNDINIYKVGVEWDVNPGLTLRGGYSYNDAPIPSTAVQSNIIAPATVQHHFTAGAKLAMSETMDLELAGMYASKNSQTGPSRFFDGTLTGGDSTISMHQWELTAGVIWKLGATEAPLK